MSNTTKTETPSIDDVEREILASDLAPQVRIWLLAMIAQMRLTEQRRVAGVDHLERRIAALEAPAVKQALTDQRAGRDTLQRVAALEDELKGATASIEATATAIEDALGQHLAPLQKLESVLGTMDGLVETIAWMKGARAGIEKLSAFLSPVIGNTNPPLDGAQIATRAMLDQQLALLSRTLHETIDRVRRDVSARLIEHDKALAAPRIYAGRALLARLLRRGE